LVAVAGALPAQRSAQPGGKVQQGAKAPQSGKIEPAARFRVVASEAAPVARWIEDAVALRGAWRRVRASGAVPEIDFGRHVALFCVRPLALGRAMTWRAGELDAGQWRVRLGPASEPAVAPGPAGQRPEPAREVGAMFVVPRPLRPVRIEWPRGEDWIEIATLPPPIDPRQAELPPISRIHELHDSDLKKLFVERATTPAAWRELRALIGEQAASLPADFADFDRECVVVVAPGEADSFPGIGVVPATEEGVDVLTITESRPSGRYIEPHAPVLLLKLPRRDHQLTVVVRRVHGPQPGGENSVRTFPPLR